MDIRGLLEQTSHRPYEVPSSPWKFYQEWNDAVFLHWKVDKDVLREFVPMELEIDLLEGQAWVSVVAFTMEKVRPRYLPPFAPFSDFYEINIRTYVKGKGKQGVYFLSIEGAKLLACKLAKGLSELPYRYSKMLREEGTYSSMNAGYGDGLKIDYTIGQEIVNKSALEVWLTERYALFQDGKKGINAFEIQHVEWPLAKLKLHGLVCNYGRFEHLFSGAPDCVQYSAGVKVVAWGKERL